MEITNFWAKLDFYIESFLGCQKCQRNNVFKNFDGPSSKFSVHLKRSFEYLLELEGILFDIWACPAC